MDLPAFEHDTHRLNVIVESPRGGRSKYKYDEALGLFRLHKLLPAGAAFPFDFGFVPSTLGEDGDPLDVMLLTEEPVSVGALVTARLIGALVAEQTEGARTIRNDRLVAVPETEKIRPECRRLEDLPGRLLEEHEHFLVEYNRFEGRDFVIRKVDGPVEARRLVEAGTRRWQKKNHQAKEQVT